MPSEKKPVGKGRWVAKVTTDSTHPPKGLFTKRASTIARTLASRRVSPKGLASGMRMLTYFINRAGRGLSAARRSELQKAKALLSRRIDRARKSEKKAA
jgi:tRNA(adenine34) deaminase